MRVGVVNKDGKELADRYSDESFLAQRAQNEPDRIFYLPECWENLVASFRYKVGWSFDYDYQIDYNLEMFHISARVPDRDNPTSANLITVGQSFRLPEWVNMEFGRSFLRDCVHELETHEMDENILFDGERVFDPHKDDEVWPKFIEVPLPSISEG